MPEMVKTWIVFATGLGMLFLGWLIGFLDSNRNSNKKIRSAELKAQIEIEEAKRAAVEAGQKAVEAAKAAEGNSFLRLWADSSGQQRLDVDGARIDAPAAIQPDQRRRLIALLNQMRPWVEASPAVPASQPAASPRPASAPPAASTAAMPPLPAAATVEPVKVTLGQSRAARPAAAPQPKTIVQQIDEVLQKRLAGTPLGTRNIHLAEGLGGSVEVWIGLQKYKGIDEVPDPEVVAAIRAAISEWETRAK